MTDPIVAYRQFVDGSMRPVYDDGQRQYVVNDDGDRVYGVYFIPPEECDLPIVVNSCEGPFH